jgi:uncharacterized membrane protein YphA (DoxX/SURF4 family)/ElaB/YqjD/DUF883 family membrane-anchored ribosome-binding protein
VTTKLSTAFGLPDNPELLVKLNAGVQVGGGLLLATGRFRRLSALMLIGSIVPTTWAGHRFWELEDPEQRGQQRMQFLKNLGMLGGLVLELVDTEGAPSLSWRTRRMARHAGVVLTSHTHSDHNHSHELGEHVHELADRAGSWVSDAAAVAAAEAAAGRSAGGRIVATTAGRSKVAAKSAKKAAKQAAKYANQRTGDVGHLVDELWDPTRASEIVRAGQRRAAQALKAGSEQAAHVLATQAGHAGELLSVGAARAEDAVHRAEGALHRAEDAAQRGVEHLPRP